MKSTKEGVTVYKLSLVFLAMLLLFTPAWIDDANYNGYDRNQFVNWLPHQAEWDGKYENPWDNRNKRRQTEGATR
jgi:hypothetical protein